MIKHAIYLLFAMIAFNSCSNNSEKEAKGFSVSEITEDEDSEKPTGLAKDTVFATQPYSVLLTAYPEHRLTPLFKVNYNKRTQTNFIGSIAYHYLYLEEYDEQSGNNWHNNLMPGFEAVYGYNLVNVSHFNTVTQTQQTFFEKPVLIKTLYYPSFYKDTLNNKAVTRKFYMVSTYDDDTNKDGMINIQDLRRFYSFDIDGANKKPLIPINYSVLRSEYDSGNDFMYVFAKLDENSNGQCEDKEPMHIFWIDLNNPEKTGRQL